MTNETILNIIDSLKEIQEDNSVPKNIKGKIAKTINHLQNKTDDLTTNVHKALQELDELSDDATMQSFTRTQIWNIVSLLESL